MRIGVDTGGTFTDCVLVEKSGIRIRKVFSSAGDPARNILQGVRELVGPGSGATLSSFHGTIVHGTTVGTNSLLERRGARAALVTTAGFEDLIEIGRQNRPELYNLNVCREPPLVPASLRWGVRERTAANGKILFAPTSRELAHLLREIQGCGAESIAICFLFSFLNPQNERRVTRILRQLGLPISVSHEILPEFREYERLSSVVINAYLAPRLGRYLSRLEQELKRGARARLSSRKKPTSSGARVYIMQSSGGITTAARAAREPVRTILSGPAGGVVAARRLADLAGIRRAISFDMGGTSTDVCLLDGPPSTTSETTLGGLPVAVPVLDIHSVGAGGGSLVRMDAGGALRVGPGSAGSSPGPICYDRGGLQPTVTDANVVLGRLDPDCFLGGDFQLDPRAAERRFQEFLRSQRQRSSARASFRNAIDLASGIVAISNATMEKALRVISVERGHDPRDFSLICFGGAGGLHAAELARSLGLAQVIVPPNPGAFSAFGILLSDFVKDLSQSVLLPVGREAANRRSRKASDLHQELELRFLRLERQARSELRKDRFPGGRSVVERRLDLRYAGQSYELSVPFSARFVESFHREHEKAYGYRDPSRPIEIVNLRLRLVVPTPKPRIRPERLKRSSAVRRALLKEKPVWFGGRKHRTRFYERRRLAPGMQFDGPAVVVEYSSTTLVPPGFRCGVDEYRNLVLRNHAR
jgi:N-methylhydantoinase A